MIQENSGLILLSIEESPGQQHLLVERRDGVIARIALDESVQYIRNSLRNAVEEEIRSTSGLVIFIVFSYDSSVIYQTDYLMVHRFLQEKQDMENVYTVEYDTR